MTKHAPNPKAAAFFRGAEKWRKEMEQMRSIVLDCGLDEEVKWGKPCYTFAGNNIVIIQAFKEYCALLFFKGALLKDPRRILVQQTENVQSARQLRFTQLQDIIKLKPVVQAYVHEAVAAEKAGLKIVYKKTADFPVAQEFKDKLDKTPALKKAFAALTPGRQRGYLLYFSSAKQSATRAARVEKCTPRILQGRGWNED